MSVACFNENEVKNIMKEKKRVFKSVWLLPLLSIGIISVGSISVVACSESVQTTTDADTTTKYLPDVKDCIVITLDNNDVVYGHVEKLLDSDAGLLINGKSYYYKDNIKVEPFPFEPSQYVSVTYNNSKHYGSIIKIYDPSYLFLDNGENIPWKDITKISLSTKPTQTQFKIGDYVNVKTKSNITYYGSISKMDSNGSGLTLSLSNNTYDISSNDIDSISLTQAFPFKSDSLVQIQTTIDASTRIGHISSETNPKQLILTETVASNGISLGKYAINWGLISNISPFSSTSLPSILDPFNVGDYVNIATYSNLLYYGVISKKSNDSVVLSQYNNNLSTINVSDIKNIEKTNQFPFAIGNCVQITSKLNSNKISWGTISKVTPLYLEVVVNNTTTIDKFVFGWNNIVDIKSMPNLTLNSWISFTTIEGKAYYGCLKQYSSYDLTLTLGSNSKTVSLSNIKISSIKLQNEEFSLKIGSSIKIQTIIDASIITGHVSSETNPEQLILTETTSSSGISLGKYAINWGAISKISS
ncbi:hypothetical protein [Mycoplasmoides alvi]|uniref:hypothetical protein n=1 Tax=Mycoplasmoides alvi TaxID=78580 RepID=UPI00051B6ECC|nr:hypothetical protein [Mycoplasmoides alvi]